MSVIELTGKQHVWNCTAISINVWDQVIKKKTIQQIFSFMHRFLFIYFYISIYKYIYIYTYIYTYIVFIRALASVNSCRSWHELVVMAALLLLCCLGAATAGVCRSLAALLPRDTRSIRSWLKGTTSSVTPKCCQSQHPKWMNKRNEQIKTEHLRTQLVRSCGPQHI